MSVIRPRTVCYASAKSFAGKRKESRHDTPNPPLLRKVRPNINPRGGNLILDSLDRDDYSHLISLLEPCRLEARETLQEAGEPVRYVYFPTNGIISVLTALESGLTIEFATVGHEGMTGVLPFLRLGNVNTALVSQVPGEAFRLRSEDFVIEVERRKRFAELVTRYSGLVLALVSQMAACNRAHQVEERCARWLLMTSDELAGSSFPVTQEFVAQMLGVSRPSVALAAEGLRRHGLISYSRGQVAIIDREGLEEIACECYEVVREAIDEFAGYCRMRPR